MFCMYAIGIVLAPLVALALKRTLLRGETPAFVMEMPLYKRPVVAHGGPAGCTTAAGRFIRRAGTMILATMVLVWALLYFPHTDDQGRKYEERIAEVKQADATDEDEKGEDQRDPGRVEGASLLGRFGHAIEPAVKPLGWDWRIAVAALASFPPGGGRRHARHRVPGRARSRRTTSRVRCRELGARLRAGEVGRHRPQGLHGPGGVVADGVLRPLLPVCLDAGGDPPRDKKLGLAGVYVHLHDGAGVPRGVGNISGGDASGRFLSTQRKQVGTCLRCVLRKRPEARAERWTGNYHSLSCASPVLPPTSPGRRGVPGSAGKAVAAGAVAANGLLRRRNRNRLHRVSFP